MSGADTGTAAFTADCGHVIPALPAGHCGGTGYGRDAISGATRCYDCCAALEAQRMIETGRATLYLVQRTPSPSQWHVTDWPGKLDFAAHSMTRATGWGFGRSYPIVCGRFTGPDGKPWAFRHAGHNSQLAHCRRVAG